VVVCRHLHPLLLPPPPSHVPRVVLIFLFAAAAAAATLILPFAVLSWQAVNLRTLPEQPSALQMAERSRTMPVTLLTRPVSPPPLPHLPLPLP
jgi:hypothetical protein